MLRVFWFFGISFLLVYSIVAQSFPKVNPGRVIRHQVSYSKDTSKLQNRMVDIWIPPDFSRSKRYGVLIMHDGQMLYDPTITWNKQAWNVDSISGNLMKSKKVNRFIIVGVHNAGADRHKEYFPQRVFDGLSPIEKDSLLAQLRSSGRAQISFEPYSDHYVKFLADELLPFLRKTYPVKRGRSSIGLAGSSMGGLISIYGLCERPRSFGFALCISTHWIGTFQKNNPFPIAMLDYLKQNLPKQKGRKVYMDHGDQTLDALYEDWQIEVNKIFKEKNWDTFHFRSLTFPGKNHSEEAWSERFHLPLLFSFGFN